MKILHHNATWFLIGAAVMYFGYPYFSAMIPFGKPSQG